MTLHSQPCTALALQCSITRNTKIALATFSLHFLLSIFIVLYIFSPLLWNPNVVCDFAPSQVAMTMTYNKTVVSLNFFDLADLGNRKYMYVLFDSTIVILFLVLMATPYNAKCVSYYLCCLLAFSKMANRGMLFFFFFEEDIFEKQIEKGSV